MVLAFREGVPQGPQARRTRTPHRSVSRDQGASGQARQDGCSKRPFFAGRPWPPPLTPPGPPWPSLALAPFGPPWPPLAVLAPAGPQPPLAPHALPCQGGPPGPPLAPLSLAFAPPLTPFLPGLPTHLPIPPNITKLSVNDALFGFTFALIFGMTRMTLLA